MTWESTSVAVANVVPAGEGSEFATIAGLTPGETSIFADVLYPFSPPPGTSPSHFKAPLVYYCCGLATCPAAPPACQEIAVSHLRVAP